MAMTFPKIQFTYSKRTEALRILHIAHMVKNYFYMKKGFPVLPYRAETDTGTIYFPELKIYKNKDFWAKCNIREDELGDEKLIKEISNEIPDVKVDFSQKEKQFNEIFPKVYKEITAFVPNFFEEIDEIVIMPTNFGSVSSLYFSEYEGKKMLKLYWRVDAKLGSIFAMLFYSLIDRGKYKDFFTWEERSAIKDFFMTRSVMARYFPNYHTTLEPTKTGRNKKHLQESKEYLEKLGFRTEQVFHIIGNKIVCRDKSLELTKNELKLMKLMVERNKEVVTWDDIGDVLWGEDVAEKFSLEAMTKLVQRLRNKIEEAGVFPSIIETVRGMGYRLVD